MISSCISSFPQACAGFWILDQQKTRRMFLFDSGPGQKHLNLPFNQTSEMTEDYEA